MIAALFHFPQFLFFVIAFGKRRILFGEITAGAEFKAVGVDSVVVAAGNEIAAAVEGIGVVKG